MATPASPRPASGPSWVALAALIGACSEESVSPKLEPPTTVPKPPTLDVSLVSCRFGSEGAPEPGGTLVVGEAGAADPEEGIVRAYNLDDTSPPVDAPVAEDGGFELELGVAPGDAVRLELLGLEAASGPSDLVVSGLDAPLEPLVEPLGDCLSLGTGRLIWVEAGAEGELVVEDLCGGGIELGAPSPRSERDRIRVGADQDWPLTLEDGVPLAIRIQILEGEPGDEYLFFVEATAPEPDRRAVSVRIDGVRSRP